MTDQKGVPMKIRRKTLEQVRTVAACVSAAMSSLAVILLLVRR